MLVQAVQLRDTLQGQIVDYVRGWWHFQPNQFQIHLVIIPTFLSLLLRDILIDLSCLKADGNRMRVRKMLRYEKDGKRVTFLDFKPF
jgi:hypothetical protein